MKIILNYWISDGWYIGKLKEIPNIMSQGETLDELKDNIKDAYNLMMEDDANIPSSDVKVTEILLEMT